MATTTTSAPTTSELQDLDFLAAAFMGFDLNNKIRTYMTLTQKTLGRDWISARGIRDKFDLNHRDFFMDYFFAEKEEHCILHYSTAAQREQLVKVFLDEVAYYKDHDREFYEKVFDNMLQFWDTITEALKNKHMKMLYDYVADETEITNPEMEEQEEPETEEQERDEIEDIKNQPNYEPDEQEETEDDPGAEYEDAYDDQEEESTEEEFTEEEEEAEEQAVIQHISKSKQSKAEKQQAMKQPAAKQVEVKNVMNSQATQTTRAELNLNIPINEIVDRSVENYIDKKAGGLKEYINIRIADELKTLKPTLISIGVAKPVTIAGRVHKDFKRCLTLATRHKQVYIAGPAGTGKSTMGKQISTALQVQFGAISFTSGTAPSELVGRMDVHGHYLESLFVNCYENGGVFLFDEVDAADPNTLMIVNNALATGYLSIPARQANPRALRHKDFYCLCSGNTWGHGSNLYVGRNPLDIAFMDRFATSKMFVDYDRDLEKEIAEDYPALVKALWKMRENIQGQKIRRLVSTRAVVGGVIDLKAGDSLHDFLNSLTIDWTAEERAKALSNVI